MLEPIVCSPSSEHRLAERARIVLLAEAGKPTRAIAAALGASPGRLSRWRIRYAARGLERLKEARLLSSVRKPSSIRSSFIPIIAMSASEH